MAQQGAAVGKGGSFSATPVWKPRTQSYIYKQTVRVPVSESSLGFEAPPRYPSQGGSVLVIYFDF